MSKILKIEIDPAIVLPSDCDNMPHDLRQHLLGALTDACRRYGCEQKDLVWRIKVDKRTKQPYISVRKST